MVVDLYEQNWDLQRGVRSFEFHFTLFHIFWKKIALFTRRSTLMKLSKKLSSISSHIILIEIESILETILWTAINSALFLNFRQYNTTSSPTLKDRGSSLLLNLTSETQHLLKKMLSLSSQLITKELITLHSHIL